MQISKVTNTAENKKTKIMQRILNNDAQIRYLAEPWLMHFEQNLEGQSQYLH